MENLKFKTRNGVEVELDSVDMSDICEHYETQLIADNLRSSHTDWSKDKIQNIAAEAHRQISKYDLNEYDAIDVAIAEYSD